MKYIGATLNNHSSNSLILFGQREDGTLWQGHLDDTAGHRACSCCIAPKQKEILEKSGVKWITDQSPVEMVYTTRDEWKDVLAQHHSLPEIHPFR